LAEGRTEPAGWRRRWSAERGSGLVEFALVLPVLSSLLLGSVTGGAAYHSKITMTSAVREGSRFGATLNQAPGFGSTVRDRVVSLSTGELNNGGVCVQLVRTGSPDTVLRSYYPDGSSCPASFGSPPPTPPDMTAGYCVVKIWAHRTAKLQAMFFTNDLDLTAKSVAAYERGTTPGVC
jgi:hypothetical protein